MNSCEKGTGLGKETLEKASQSVEGSIYVSRDSTCLSSCGKRRHCRTPFDALVVNFKIGCDRVDSIRTEGPLGG